MEIALFECGNFRGGLTANLGRPRRRLRRHRVAADYHAVARRVRVIDIRMVEIVIESARFLARHRAAHHQFRHGDQVAQFDQVGIDQVIPIVAVDLLLQHQDAPQRAFEPPVTAHDTDVVPHQPANFLPAMRDQYALLALDRVAGIPFRKRRRAALVVGQLFVQRRKCPPPHHRRFEQ